VLIVLAVILLIVGIILGTCYYRNHKQRLLQHVIDAGPAAAAFPNPGFNGGAANNNQPVLYAVPMEEGAVAGGVDAADYLVAVNRNPLYHYAPPLAPPPWGGGDENPNNLEYADADAPADQSRAAGNAGLLAKDADGYVLDETIAPPSAEYSTYISSTEAGVGNYEVLDAAATGQAPEGSRALPSARDIDKTSPHDAEVANTTTAAAAAAVGTAATAVQRCPHCKVKVQVCTCRVRRGTQDMANKQPQAKCVQSTSQGPCQQLSVGKSPRCVDHTCQHSKCHAGKSSKARYCKKHGKQQQKPAPGAGVGADTFVLAVYDQNDAHPARAGNGAAAYVPTLSVYGEAAYAPATSDQSLA
jgi:hypothetical protein